MDETGEEETYPTAAKIRYLEYGTRGEIGHCRSRSKGVLCDTILWGITCDQKDPGTKSADHSTDAINAENVLDITCQYITRF